MPLALEASFGWESGHTVSAIADILLREILGINTTFVCTWGSVHAMKLLAGCKNPMDAFQPCVVDGLPELPTPLAHVSVESWVTTPAEHDEMNKYNINLGMLGYYSKSGLYFDKNIAVEAFEKEKLSLEWWQGFSELPQVSNYFDNYIDIAVDVNTTFDGAVEPRCKDKDNGFLALQKLNFTCTDGWFFGPACQSDKESCIPVILAEYDWNGLEWIKAIVQHGYRFAITWLGASHSLAYSMRTNKRMLFYCATTSALCYEKPVVKMFADTHMPVGRPDLITSLLKVIWKQLPEIDERIYELIAQMNFPTADLEALMAAYSAKIKPNQSIMPLVDDFVPEIACNWIKNTLKVNTHAGTFTGPNTAKWARWIPRTCDPGWEYDKAAGACRPCKLGEYSADGRQCIPCIPGSFANREATESCLLCDQGKWQSATGGTTCDDCLAGTRRSSKDHGCTACTPGTFSSSPGQAECERCARGFWNSETGSTQCSQCPSDLTTLNEEAISAEECICTKSTYWPCQSGASNRSLSADENTFYSALNDACSIGAFTASLKCATCPQGMECSGGKQTIKQSSWHAQPFIPAGYYVEPDNPYQAFKCNNAGAMCLGDFRTGVEQCAGSGRYGRQCHACPQGHRARFAEPCSDCAVSGAFALLPFCIILLAVVLGVIYMLSSGKKDKSPSKTAMIGTLSIIAVNTQMFSIVVSLSVGWSGTFIRYLGWMEIFAFQMDGMTASSCYFGNDTLSPNYLPGLLLPVIVIGMMLVMWGLSQLLARTSSRFAPMKMDQSINALGMVLMTMYIAVCKAVFNIFECKTNPSAPKTLRSHDGFLCSGDDVVDMIPMAVLGALVYIIAFGALYVWVIARAPSAYQSDAGFRLRTDFLLRRWHPEFWFWGIFFLLRNLACSVVPSISTDGSQQILMMFALLLPMFIAQVRVWPWRDELANKHDLIMVSSLLCTLVIALALQAPTDNADSWPSFLEVLSTLTFVSAVIACLVILAHFLCTEVRIQKASARRESLSMPTLMTSPEPTGKEVSLVVDSQGSKSWSGGRTSRGLESLDEKVLDIYKTLNALSTGDQTSLLDLVKQMGNELPTADLKKLQWGMGVVGYHVLGDMTKKPVGIVLAPAATRANSASRLSSRQPAEVEKSSVTV